MFPGVEGTFVHAFDDPQVMAGNATIALEVLEELPDVDAIVTPWGGGGLTCGVAVAVRELRPHQGGGCGSRGAAPYAAAVAAGRPVESISPLLRRWDRQPARSSRRCSSGHRVWGWSRP